MDRKWILVGLACVILLVMGFMVYHRLTRPLDTAGMSPDAVARKFFESLSTGDVNVLRCIVPKAGMFEEPNFRPRVLGLRIISIGKPFQKPNFPEKSQWYVPYEVRLKTGEIRKGDLGFIQSHPRHRGKWTFDGGF